MSQRQKKAKRREDGQLNHRRRRQLMAEFLVDLYRKPWWERLAWGFGALFKCL